MELDMIKTADLETIEARNNELKGIDIDSLTSIEEVNAYVEERDAIEARLAEFEALASKKQELRKKIANGEVDTKPIEKPKGEEKMELRDSVDYGRAYVKAILKGDDTELRALLTSEHSGSVPVPTLLDTEIRNAWENCQLLGLANQTFYNGNVKVGFEYSATGAVVHVEGAEAPEEEELVLGVVELKAESIKKWITVSDEAIDNTTIDTLGYIYKELAQKIAEKAEALMVAKIVAAPATSSATACGVPVHVANTVAVDTITMALANLSGQARNVTLVMNRGTYAALKAAGKKANYNMDVFDGCPVVFTDALKSHTTASVGDTYVIAGDFGYGFQVNFPHNHQLSIKVDDLSLAEKDLVKIVGREYAGMGVVAPKAFVKINK